jgi:hypothetical protein
VAILIKLVAQDRDRDHQSADNQKEDVASRHWNLPAQSNRECRIAWRALSPRVKRTERKRGLFGQNAIKPDAKFDR